MQNANCNGVNASSVAPCGHLLKESEANRGVIQCTLDFLSIPNICHEEGTTSWPPIRENYSTKRSFYCPQFEKDASEGISEGIHYFFVNDPDFRACQLEHDRDEEVCIKMDELAQEDCGHHMTKEEYCRYRIIWISLINF